MITIILTSSLCSFLASILLFVNIYGVHSTFAGTNGGTCREREQMALLKFKAELIDEYGLLSSWGSTNCCQWKGVACDNRTNHVVALHLYGGYSPLRGKIDSSLLQLPYLQYLDLSANEFGASFIPDFIGSLSNLQHLDLGYCRFWGPIPHNIGNLSSLRFLSLAGLEYSPMLTETNIDWLSGAPSLEFLNLNDASLKECYTWPQAIQKLTALKTLLLSYCELPMFAPIPAPSQNSSNSFVELDLSHNNDPFGSSALVLSWFLNMSSSFSHIDLSQDAFEVEVRNISQNAKGRNNIPADLGNCNSLSYLGLQYSGLEGSIPNAILNLTSLSYLDLSVNQLHGEFPQTSKNSSSLLTYLDLSSNTLNGQLSHLLTWLHDSPRLKYVSLKENLLCGSFPNMSRFSLLKELYLQNNLLNGTLLEDYLRLPHLENLDLSTNKFTGKLPNLSACPLLSVIHMSNNTFNAILNESIGNLPNLKEFVVGYNKYLEGVISEAHLSSLLQLRVLDLSFNLNITIMVSSSWMHPVQFIVLKLANCKLGPNFPKWLHKHNQLYTLDISNSGIFDTIPGWFWGNMHMCKNLNLSYNHIFGVLPNITSNSLTSIDLSSNELSGTLPLFPPVLTTIALSSNKFSGTIHFFCKVEFIFSLVDLSNNWLSGNIPQGCLKMLLSTSYLNLANNHFTGELPNATTMCRVSSLHLRNNNFTGEIPRSLMNCSELRILDLGENEFRGRIPRWLGENMPELGVLILKSNMLYGSLPLSICHLSNLQVLDLSSNKITGSIPTCINNFTLLSLETNSVYWNNPFIASRNDSEFYDSASVYWKGKEETYIKNLELLKMIDLSSNQLNGEIPHEVTSLFGLLGLNLSRNNLVGFIPGNMDHMKLLNFLDLSRNKLSGGIPPTLSKLSHLGVLDLSFNNLSGRIPWDTHMQTFNASVYSGNPRLCGLPLASRPCPEDEEPTRKSDDSKEEHKFMMRGFYISMVIGFIVAFWGAFWALFISKWWNVVSTKICITIIDWLYVKILVNKRRLIRYFRNV